ncbi:MAG TPA: response regulator transcription factor [Azoarcus taiwanensis]|uniref:Response regulator n=1 Tax=Azoarcus taiwanensis TaxID=666964 RepID=A0A972F6X3_9RHOO|nr:response regulator [Azoarcus taiwanensis]HRQ56588.1 response regulator transcription factor [Azoarcus taiwanensis]
MRLGCLEDDTDTREAVRSWLEAAGHDVHVFASGRDFMRTAARESFDLFVLDSNLPDVSGPEVLHWLRTDRNDATPVVFVTARDAEEDIVAQLTAGADDYIVKPVRRAELIARIDAVLRRTRPAPASDALEAGPYRFDLVHKRVHDDGEEIALTDKEFDLAVFLFRNVGRLLSRGHLLEAVWGRNPSVATRTVDTHVSRVRGKLKLRPDRGFRLVPTYNYGYRLECTTDPEPPSFTGS